MFLITVPCILCIEHLFDPKQVKQKRNSMHILVSRYLHQFAEGICQQHCLQIPGRFLQCAQHLQILQHLTNRTSTEHLMYTVLLSYYN